MRPAHVHEANNDEERASSPAALIEENAELRNKIHQLESLLADPRVILPSGVKNGRAADHPLPQSHHPGHAQGHDEGLGEGGDEEQGDDGAGSRLGGTPHRVDVRTIHTHGENRSGQTPRARVLQQRGQPHPAASPRHLPPKHPTPHAHAHGHNNDHHHTPVPHTPGGGGGGGGGYGPARRVPSGVIKRPTPHRLTHQGSGSGFSRERSEGSDGPHHTPHRAGGGGGKREGSVGSANSFGVGRPASSVPGISLTPVAKKESGLAGRLHSPRPDRLAASPRVGGPKTGARVTPRVIAPKPLHQQRAIPMARKILPKREGVKNSHRSMSKGPSREDLDKVRQLNRDRHNNPDAWKRAQEERRKAEETRKRAEELRRAEHQEQLRAEMRRKPTTPRPSPGPRPLGSSRAPSRVLPTTPRATPTTPRATPTTPRTKPPTPHARAAPHTPQGTRGAGQPRLPHTPGGAQFRVGKVPEEELRRRERERAEKEREEREEREREERERERAALKQEAVPSRKASIDGAEREVLVEPESIGGSIHTPHSPTARPDHGAHAHHPPPEDADRGSPHHSGLNHHDHNHQRHHYHHERHEDKEDDEGEGGGVPGLQRANGTLHTMHVNENTGALEASPAPSPVPSPRILTNLSLDDFIEHGTLGKGCFGKVKFVTHRATNREFALKVLNKRHQIQQQQVQHAINENHILRLMDHPFIVKYYGSFQDRDNLYILMERVQGTEFYDLLQDVKCFTEEQTRFLAAQLVLILEHLHNQHTVVYRDLKPENILIDGSGYLKLTDFGFAKIEPNKTFTFCGTPCYIAPEIIYQTGYDKAVDWWALGVMIYEMLEGEPPLDNDDLLQLYDDILNTQPEFPPSFSPEAADLIRQLLAKEPHKRLGVRGAGAADVRRHPFFRGVDWEGIEERRVESPFGDMEYLRDGLEPYSDDEEDEPFERLNDHEQTLFEDF